MQKVNLLYIALALSLSWLGCTEARPLVSDPRAVVTWEDDVAPMVAEHCTPCHSGAQPAGNYLTADYGGVLGPGLDPTPNAIAGDGSSRLLLVLDAPDPSSPHAGLQNDLALLQKWVVKYALAYSRSSIHPGGLLDPSQPEFHGKLLRASGFDLGLCKRCHGADLSGGAAGKSCLGCHDRGPADCVTCHASVTSFEPHRTHLLGGGLGQTYTCGDCHDRPKSFADPEHFGTPASVAFTGGMASGRTPTPTWDPQTRTCTNIYCHSLDGNDSAGLLPAPIWSANTRIQCGSCHGLPPSDGLHASGTAIRDCSRCHPSTMDRNGLIVVSPVDGGRSTKHLNGVVDVP
jgi:predicted CxxxxCH...CXXCH cytochrome family protein